MMIEMVFELPSYRSPLDEDSFFSWLEAICCYAGCKGVGRCLHVYLDETKLSEDTVYELVGLFSRYNLQMNVLAVLVSSSVGYLIEDKNKWWYSSVFLVK